ncbi:MAG: exo-alpha-sialidase [Planctomycetes bacterium]|nr:exo-alpha-sialidase [Planctomycetota bacterium]
MKMGTFETLEKNGPCWLRLASLRLAQGALLLVLIISAVKPACATGVVNQVTVFESNGVDGYLSIRIPAIVQATNGDLLAFAEGRLNDPGNTGNTDMLLKRSTDGGHTWGSLQIIDNNLGWTMGNPSPVVSTLDPVNPGRVWLTYNRENSDIFTRYSDDNGATWSSRTDITTSVKDPAWLHFANGPGHAIELTRGPNAGRLVIPANFGLASDPSLLGQNLFYSDDYGITWQSGASETPTSSADLFPNENSVTELVNGDLYVNARVQNGTPGNTRAIATSTDGGETYSGPFTVDPQFNTPVVQNSVVRFAATDEGDAQNILLYSGPVGTVRENLTLRVSYDEGTTWVDDTLIHPGPAAYSDLVKLDSQEFGVLYEAGNTLYDKVLFSSYNLDALINPTENADFDSDNDVDGADFLTWQRSFLTDAGGDANADGLTNGLDLGIWENQFGTVLPAVGAASTVPEPSSLLIAFVGGMIAMVIGRRQSAKAHRSF